MRRGERLTERRQGQFKTCQFEDCDKPHKARGYCSTHHKMWLRTNGTMLLQPVHETDEVYLERFWSRVEKTETCWLWTRGEMHGYGAFMTHGRNHRAHVWIWKQLVGEIPEGMEIDHQCRVRRCVRPDHLRLATHKQNGENKSNEGYGTTGVRGVTRSTTGKPFTARVGHHGVMYHLGQFDTIEEASEAVRLKRLALHTYNTEDRESA